MADFRYPLGYRFCPTEEELVFYYLKSKIENKPFPPGVVEEVDIYGDKNPWEIFKNDSNEYFYVFAKLKRRKKRRRNDDNSEASVRFDRTAGIGTWKGRQCNNKDDQDSSTSWLKKDYIFEVRGNTKNFDHGRWIMMELSLPQCEDYVICRIYNKDAKPNAKEMEYHELDQFFDAVIKSCSHNNEEVITSPDNVMPLAVLPATEPCLHQPITVTNSLPSLPTPAPDAMQADDTFTKSPPIAELSFPEQIKPCFQAASIDVDAFDDVGLVSLPTEELQPMTDALPLLAPPDEANNEMPAAAESCLYQPLPSLPLDAIQADQASRTSPTPTVETHEHSVSSRFQPASANVHDFGSVFSRTEELHEQFFFEQMDSYFLSNSNLDPFDDLRFDFP